MEITVGQTIEATSGRKFVVDGVENLLNFPALAIDMALRGWSPVMVHVVPCSGKGRGRVCLVDAKNGRIVEVYKA